MRLVAAALQVAGLAAVATAGWMLSPWVGVGIGGVALFVVGVVVEPRRGS